MRWLQLCAALLTVRQAALLLVQQPAPSSPLGLRRELFWDSVDRHVITNASGHERLAQFAQNHWDLIARSNTAHPLAPGQQCDVPFPGLTARPWHDKTTFRWAARVEAGAGAAVSELAQFSDASERSADDDHSWNRAVTRLCENTDAFSKLILRADGAGTRVGTKHFPKTLALLNDLPLSPRPVAINRQRARSGLDPHSDNLNFVLACHLGLVVPEGCRFVVAGAPPRPWQRGRLLIADTTFVHHTTNPSEADRCVLHFSIWHPELTLEERRGIERMHAALREYEEACVREGIGAAAA